jgi:hypothetical protein
MRNFCNLHRSLGVRKTKSKRLQWDGFAARMGEARKPKRILVGKPLGKYPLGRPRRKLEDNIQIYLKEIGFEDDGWNWIGIVSSGGLTHK